MARARAVATRWFTFPLLALTGCTDDGGGTVPTAAMEARPLVGKERSGPLRFRRLAPEESGIEFQNELRRENVVPYVYSGAGVAAGDYDQDGLADLYLVSQDGPNRLYRQVAPMRFVDVTQAAGGVDGGEAWGTAASFADVDGDGDLDLYVCNTEAPNLLYQNQGDGTFREVGARWGLGMVAASTGCAFGDYDNDGDLDLYLLTNRVFGPRLPEQLANEVTPPTDTRKTTAQMFPTEMPRLREGNWNGPAGWQDFYSTVEEHVFPAGQRDMLLRNDGYAHWTDVTDMAGVADHGNGLSVVWWDCDLDSDLDLYVANDLQTPDRFYENRGDGTFVDVTRERLPHTAFYGMGSDFGDVDGDGRMDLIVADMSSTSHYMGKMLMGNMGDQRWFLMNADPQQYMRNSVFLGTGSRRYTEASRLLRLDSTDWTWTVRLCDLDNDRRLDLFATNGIPVFEDDPDAAMEFTKLWRAGQREQALDIARNLEPVRERNIARRNVGDYRFEDVGAQWGLDEESVGQGAVVCDLDRDGDLDIVVNNQNQPVAVYENTGSRGRSLLVQLHGRQSNRFGVGAIVVVEADGQRQLEQISPTRGYMSSGEPMAHFGLGDASVVDRIEVRWPSGARQEFRGLAADQLVTIREPDPTEAVGVVAPGAELSATFVAAEVPAVRHREQDFDDYQLQPLLPHRMSRAGPGMAATDGELWVGGAAGQAGTLLRDGVPVDGPWQQDAACEDMGALFFDADGDADLDLYVVSGGIEHGDRTELLRDRLYLRSADGSFGKVRAGTLPDLEISGSCVVGADFDRDGDVDLFLGGRTVAGRFPEAPRSVLLQNDAGTFREVPAEIAAPLQALGMVSAAVWADVDGDGWLDLCVASQWQPVRVLRNQGGTAFKDATAALGLSSLKGQWNGIDAQDLDNDGDLDLVVTNLGLNTKYKVSDGHPLRLFARDFDGNGQLDIVEAKYQGDTLLPVRGRSCSSEAMPFLAQKFETFDRFARATLPEIYGADQLASCLELQCTELQHTVFENRCGSGEGFVAYPLPRLAQIAPGYGLLATDVDADGLLDLLVVHNTFSPEPESGRFAGGLSVLLRNTGGLGFACVDAGDSGIVLPGDTKALVEFGDGTLVFSVNDAETVALRRAARSTGLEVRLEGGPGNPTGVGSVVRLSSAAGTPALQVRPLVAGSGYLSQSDAVARFGAVPDDAVVEVIWPDGGTTRHEVSGRQTLKVQR
jgi:hypothetical protein